MQFKMYIAKGRYTKIVMGEIIIKWILKAKVLLLEGEEK